MKLQYEKIIPKYPYSKFYILKKLYPIYLKYIFYDKIVFIKIYKNSKFNIIIKIYINLKFSVKF